MRAKEERRTEREWRCQEMWKRKKKENKKRAIEERKCFEYREFGHRASHCRKVEEEELTQVPSNRFEVLKVRVMQRGKESGKKVTKDRREILREERAKRGVEARQIKIEKRKRTLRKVIVKIGLKQKEEEGIATEVLLDSRATGLVMSKEFVRKHRFRRMELEKPLYMRNVNSTFNHVGPIVDMVEVEEKDIDRCDRKSEVEHHIRYAMASTP